MSVERLERLGRTAWWLTFSLYLLQVGVWTLGLAVVATWVVWSGYWPAWISRGVPGFVVYAGVLLFLFIRFRHFEWRRPCAMRVAEAIERQRYRGSGRELSTQVSLMTDLAWRERSSEELVEAALAGTRSRLDIEAMPSPIAWRGLGLGIAVLGIVSLVYAIPFWWLRQPWMLASQVVWAPWDSAGVVVPDPMPQVESWRLMGQELILDYPEVLHLPSQRFAEFPAVPVGSRVQVVATLSGSLEGTTIAIESSLAGSVPRWQLGEREGELILGGENGEGHVLEESQRWRIGVWTDVRADRVWRDLAEILVVADRPPEVEDLEYGRVSTVSNEGAVVSDIMASDDFGLATVETFWEVTRRSSRSLGESGREVLYRWEEATSRVPESTWRGIWKPRLSAMYAFEPGDVLTYWTEATDLQGQVSASSRSQVTIASPESLLQPMLPDIAALIKRLEQCERWQNELVLRLRQEQDRGEVEEGEVRSDERSVWLESQVQDLLLRRADSVASQIDALIDRGNQQNLGATSTMAHLRTIGIEVVQLDAVLEEVLLRLVRVGRLPVDEVVGVEETISRWIERLKGVSETVSRQNALEEMSNDQSRLRDATARLLADARSELSGQDRRDVSESLSRSQQELSEQLAGFLRDLSEESSKDVSASFQGDVKRDAEWLSALQSRDTLSRMRQAVAALQADQPEKALPMQQELATELKEMMARSPSVGSGTQRWMELLRDLVPKQAQVVAACLEDAVDEVKYSEGLSRQQKEIMELCRVAFEKDKSRAGVVEWVGQTAIAAMERGTEAMRRGERRTDGHRYALQGLDRLKSIAGAFMVESTSPQDAGSGQETESDQASGASSQESGLRLYQQLVLLREVQDSIRERLEAVASESRDRKLNPREWLEVNQLANQQNELLIELQKLGAGLGNPRSEIEAGGEK